MFERLLRPLLYGAIAVLLCSGGTATLMAYYWLHKPMLPAEKESIVFEVPFHSTATELITRLYQKDLIASKVLFLKYIRYKHLAHKIKAGFYQINPNDSALDFLHKVIKGDVLRLSFLIVEGSNNKEVENDLRQAPYLRYQPEDWKTIQENYHSPEGLLLAETYQYEAGVEAKAILKMASTALKTYLDNAWKNRDPTLPYRSPYEMLIAASIIEKETGLEEERSLISGVIVNRLKKHMRLQMDPTVIYALGENYQGKLHHKDMQINSPYNTYRYVGLPPTPIAIVGKEAIEAAAHPASTNYLYFVARGDGSHIFSDNYKSQKIAIKLYQKSER